MEKPLDNVPELLPDANELKLKPEEKKLEEKKPEEKKT